MSSKIWYSPIKLDSHSPFSHLVIRDCAAIQHIEISKLGNLVKLLFLVLPFDGNRFNSSIILKNTVISGDHFLKKKRKK